MTVVDPRPAVWLLAIRPRTLPAAVGPVLVGIGVALSLDRFQPVVAAACLAVAVLLQVVANLANDLFDFERGADTADRLGPPRVAASGLATRSQLRVAIGVVLGLAAVIGLYLVTVGGPVFLLLGALAMLSALAYTGGPWPYGYHSLGDPLVFTWFGLVAVIGTAALQTGSLEPLAIGAAVPVGALVTAILVVNNLRDRSTDGAAGKRTLAVRLGERGSVAEFTLLLTVAYASPLILVATGSAPALALLPIVSLPLAWPLLRAVRSSGDPRRLNPVLKSTAELSLVYSVLLAISLALGGGA